MLRGNGMVMLSVCAFNREFLMYRFNDDGRLIIFTEDPRHDPMFTGEVEEVTWDELGTDRLLQPETTTIVGRKSDNKKHYREFLNVAELLAAGFIELGDWERPYRLDSWESYQRQKPPF